MFLRLFEVPTNIFKLESKNATRARAKGYIALRRVYPRRIFLASLVLFSSVLSFAVATGSGLVEARSKVAQFSAKLNARDRRLFEAWYYAQITHSASVDAYWDDVERKRKIRRRVRKNSGWNFASRHYVTHGVPRYKGPSLNRGLLLRWRTFRDKDKPKRPIKQSTIPNVKAYLSYARRYYNFVPERIPEIEFKRRYASEALKNGLSGDQVVRIYALETGGYGTADMQAGIHPITGKGRPISSALGYAQLLAANTINMVERYGSRFVKRLEELKTRATDPQRRARLAQKIKSLKVMIRTARSIPATWSRQVKLSRSSRGQGLHPLNIDGDIGPWLQVTKLVELKKMAARRGRKNLSGAEIELMNLAGPATGLEMMMPVARNMPTTNFFARRGYYRNTIVRNKTAQQLLVALDQRMQSNIKKPGAVEFAAVFRDLERRNVRSARSN